MSGARGGSPIGAPLDASGLPPLVLRCRPIWRIAYGGTGASLLALAAVALAADLTPGGPEPMTLGAASVLFLLGAGCTQFFLRFCLARLTLNEGGFRLAGPLRGGSAIAWSDVREWRRTRRLAGHGALQIVHGADGSRASIPLIYEDGHLLELGLGQRHFPAW